MKIIVAVDDDNGLLFNHRRQSKDSELRREMLNLCKDNILRMNEYSAKQFDIMPKNIQISESFLEEACEDDYCFVEDKEIMPYADKIEEIILFHWNRKYPSDLKLDYIPQNYHMKLLESRDFVGNSHDKITMEVWVRNV